MVIPQQLASFFCFLAIGVALPTLQFPQTKTFQLDLTWETRAPDGVERQVALVNGQYPGPPLILDEGDNVEVVVNNFMPFDTALHFHGIEQYGSSWSDGVPGVSQRLISSGDRFVSTFTVQQYGTYWYHSHSSGQMMDGLYGPIYIRPRASTKGSASMITNDTLEQTYVDNAIKNPKLILVSDWFHMTSEALHENALLANVDDICADSFLFNGKGRVHCRDPAWLTSMASEQLRPVLQGMNYTAKGCVPLADTYAQTTSAHDFSAVPPSLFDECNATTAAEEFIEVDPASRWTSLNFIGSTAISAPTVSINNHTLWVYEIDGQYIIPQQVDALTIQNGARYSCLVQLNNTAGDYMITAANSGFNQRIAGFGYLSYIGGDASISSEPSIDYGGRNTSSEVVFLDEATTQPLIPDQPSQEADETHILTVGRLEKAWKWSLNGNHSYDLSLEAEKPLLWRPEHAANSSLVISTRNNTWVDIIFVAEADASSVQPSHPIHKHSNPAYVIGSGLGAFNWKSVKEAAKASPENFNLITPPLRDTFTTLPAFKQPSWLAIRYHVRNPGAFLLHCHIDPHLVGGMALGILDGVDAWPEVPAQYGPDGQWGPAII